MSGDGPLLEARGLAFGYPLPGGGSRPVLTGLDLRVARGELVGLLGANGSGKTTLLRLVAGTLRPDAGSIAFDGRAVAAWPRRELARRVAVLPQSLELPDGFRVGELVEMGRTPHATRAWGSSELDRHAVARALAEADALELVDRLAGELSGGERQRVLVAMALAQEPELLLLDEPTLHLDVRHQVALLETLTRLGRGRQITTVAVLHDLGLAAVFMPRAVVIEAGRVAADGAPADVLRSGLVRRVFGVVADEAYTADGRRHLVVGPARG